MAVDAVLFVSKRATVAAAALLCLMAGRLLTSQQPTAAASPTEVRVSITSFATR
jgi:hypothetical protein